MAVGPGVRPWLVGLTTVLLGTGGWPAPGSASAAGQGVDPAAPALPDQRLRAAAPAATPGGLPARVPGGPPAPGPGGPPAPAPGPGPTGAAELRAGAAQRRAVPAYHHLGATTEGGWSGVLGRMTVRDPAVRRDTHDFLATRFMAKHQVDQRVSWLEVGWAETGWSGDGRQRIYTFDTNSKAWTFYDQFELRDGDEIWVYLHTDAPAAAEGGETNWQAWLWWGSEWHLLTSQHLPLGSSAQMEQYVEAHVDPRHGGRGFAVPPVAVDNVQVKTDPRGQLRYWNAEVPTYWAGGRDRYCLDWTQRFDTWSAGDCPGG